MGSGSMTPFAENVVREIAAEERVLFQKVLGPERLPRLVRARAKIARRLHEAGYRVFMIAKVLNKDSSTISYYLSKPKLVLPWKKPVVELLYCVVPEVVTPAAKRKTAAPPKDMPLVRRRYLIPYVGADMTMYVWKRRPQDDRAAIPSPPLVSDVLASAGPAGGPAAEAG